MTHTHHADRPTRRQVVAAIAAAAGAGIAGCSTDESTTGTPTPVSLAGTKQCEVCGMVVAEHPGPSATTFFADQTPEGHDGPAWFDSVKERFVYVREKERLGWTPTVTYVTDYSTVDYEIADEGGTKTISRHVAPGTFAPASEVVYAAGSEVVGAMGVDLLPFTVRDDAAAFRDEHGGWLVTHDDVTEETLARLRRSERA